MSAPATTTGIVCGKCSTFSVKIRHASVAAVRLCAGTTSGPVVKITQLPPVPGTLVPSAAPSLAERTVPAGRYAVRGLDGIVKFYVVDHGREGTKWAGRIFVNVQAGDDLHPVRNPATRTGILAAILVDPRAAAVLYGRELGRCGVCNRTLTDPDSIAAGIGPVCAGRF